MKTQFLLLWLEAPLQSWGADSRFGRRDTLPFPTKSGIQGLLCCAMGAREEQTELLAEMSSLGQTVVSYVLDSVNTRGEGKGTHREPLLMDFQMVGSGYDERDSWQSLLIPKKLDGSSAVGGGTKMTYRYYLQDSKFAAVVETPEEWVGPFSEALQNPVYDLYLGRKCCTPTDFIYRGIFDSMEEGLAAAQKIGSEKGLMEDFRVVDGKAEGDSFAINDVPVQFGEVKKYRDRIVTVIRK